jgi:membrane-associated phospholipid phosphatase
MEQLLQWDQDVFQLINGAWRSPVLDFLAPLWRDKRFWIPLYLALAGYSVWKFRAKAVLFLLVSGLTVGISDTLSSRVVKPAVARLRPCNDLAMQPDVHLSVHCGSGYSFTSSHAANHFAVAAWLFTTLGMLHRRVRWLWWLWAASIAYAQVYVGVHYPGDVLGGAVLGMGVGFLSAGLYLRRRDISAFS